MQSTINNKRIAVLLLCIAILTGIIYIVDRNAKKTVNARAGAQASNAYGVPLPKSKSTPNPDILPNIKVMSNVPPDYNNRIALGPDLDRQRLERESTTLLPANEETKLSYKEWLGVDDGSIDKELYANVAPLFANQSNGPLVPLDVNGSQRRINFY